MSVLVWIMCMVISVWWSTRTGCPHSAANELRLRPCPSAPALALAVTGCLLSNCQSCWHFKYKHDVVVAGVQFPVVPAARPVRPGPDLSATLARRNNASHLTVDTLTPARDAHKIICTLGWGNQVSGTWWRQDDRMRMNLGLLGAQSLLFLGVVLHPH